MNELEISNEILSIIQNLEKEEDAHEYTRLYLLAYHNNTEYAENEINDSEVLRLISQTDSRFEDR